MHSGMRSCGGWELQAGTQAVTVDGGDGQWLLERETVAVLFHGLVVG